MISEINKDAKNRIYTDTSIKTYLQFGLLPIKTKKGSFMRFYYDLAYARTGQPIPPFDVKIFKQKYYEANLELFHQFSRPKSLVLKINAAKAKAKALAKTKSAPKPKVVKDTTKTGK